jgi:hypothetical protein
MALITQFWNSTSITLRRRYSAMAMHRGVIIGFGFTRDAFEEVARAKKVGLNIRLMKVAEVLIATKRAGGSAKLPLPATVDEMPLPPMRKPKDMPSAEELIRSDREAAAG